MSPPSADHIIIVSGIIAPCIVLIGVWATVETARLIAQYRRDCPQLTGVENRCASTLGGDYGGSDLYASAGTDLVAGDVL
jgi:hypothetical protein